MAGAISVSGNTQRVLGEKTDVFIGALLKTAAEISRYMGYYPAFRRIHDRNCTLLSLYPPRGGGQGKSMLPVFAFQGNICLHGWRPPPHCQQHFEPFRAEVAQTRRNRFRLAS
jgi:hypothetical protein